MFFKARAPFETPAAASSTPHAEAQHPWTDDLQCEVHDWSSKVRADYRKLMKREREHLRTAVAMIKESLSVFSVAYISSALAVAFALHLGIENLAN